MNLQKIERIVEKQLARVELADTKFNVGDEVLYLHKPWLRWERGVVRGINGDRVQITDKNGETRFVSSGDVRPLR